MAAPYQTGAMSLASRPVGGADRLGLPASVLQLPRNLRQSPHDERRAYDLNEDLEAAHAHTPSRSSASISRVSVRAVAS